MMISSLQWESLSCQYRNSHYKIKTVSWCSHHYDRNPCTGKTVALYWIKAQSSECGLKSETLLEHYLSICRPWLWQRGSGWCSKAGGPAHQTSHVSRELVPVLHRMVRTIYIDGLVQDCSNSSALAMELLLSCTMWVSEWLDLMPFLGTADSQVHI